MKIIILYPPQTVRMWDSSWDVITNDNFLNTPASMENYYSNDPYKILNYDGDISLKPIDQFKFGGGWFNLLSTKLLRFTDIPDSFGPYGIDDLYVMICCNLMKQRSFKVQQYVLTDTIVIENFKYRTNPYKDYLKSIDKQIEFRTQAENNLQPEIDNFIKKLEWIK